MTTRRAKERGGQRLPHLMSLCEETLSGGRLLDLGENEEGHRGQRRHGAYLPGRGLGKGTQLFVRVPVVGVIMSPR